MYSESEIIRSRQNKTVSEVEKLCDRKERERTQTFRFDGLKLCAEAIQNRLNLTVALLKNSKVQNVAKEIFDRTQKDIFQVFARVLVLEDDLFDRISEEKSPEGVICCAKYIDKCKKIATIYNDAQFSEMENESIVLLESVRDPSNVGAIIRSAAAMGIDRLILSADCADVYHPKAVRASMGTLFSQNVDLAENLPAVAKQLTEHGRRVFAAALDREAFRLGEFQIEKRDCVVIGNEGHGLSDEMIAASTHKVFIPMSERAESLNAGVAAAILMWEFSGHSKH